MIYNLAQYHMISPEEYKEISYRELLERHMALRMILENQEE